MDFVDGFEERFGRAIRAHDAVRADAHRAPVQIRSGHIGEQQDTGRWRRRLQGLNRPPADAAVWAKVEEDDVGHFLLGEAAGLGECGGLADQRHARAIGQQASEGGTGQRVSIG
jgi:hypothetical protein